MMALTKIEIEQVEGRRWIAEVEVGGLIARRKSVRAETFDEIVLAVVDARAELSPRPVVAVEQGAAPASGGTVSAPADTNDLPASGPARRGALMREARARGLPIEATATTAELEAALGIESPD